jgi:hypothetical protein
MMAKTLKGRELVSIFAVNDGYWDAPVMFHFDTAETRTEFLKHVNAKGGRAFTIIDQMTKRDFDVLCKAVDEVTMVDLKDAINSQDQGTVQEAFEDNEDFRFYDCGDEIRDLYDDEIESGERVRGTGRTC